MLRNAKKKYNSSENGRFLFFFLKIEKSMGNLRQLQNDLKTNKYNEQLLLETIITERLKSLLYHRDTRKPKAESRFLQYFFQYFTIFPRISA